MTTVRSTAIVPTGSAARYAKQLVAHLGRKIEFTEDEAARSWVGGISTGTGRIAVTDEAVVLAAEAPDDETLRRVEHVLGSHLERFGQRQELAVVWQRDAA